MRDRAGVRDPDHGGEPSGLMARPTKLTPEVEDAMVRAILVGASYKTACQYAGISYQTFLNWRKRAGAVKERQGKSRNAPSDEFDVRLIGFVDHIKEAEAVAAIKSLVKINGAAKKDWRAAAWMLERRFPNEYGRRRAQSAGQDESDPTLAPKTAPRDDEQGLAEVGRILREFGILPPQPNSDA